MISFYKDWLTSWKLPQLVEILSIREVFNVNYRNPEVLITAHPSHAQTTMVTSQEKDTSLGSSLLTFSELTHKCPGKGIITDGKKLP